MSPYAPTNSLFNATNTVKANAASTAGNVLGGILNGLS